MRLAVIPARGGSKRVPHKNIKPFGGQPMIAWSIRAAIESRCFDRILVSTDDAEIATIARFYGADVPFLRPAELSDDHTGTIPVIAHAIEWQNANGLRTTEVCCIYATAPFVSADDLRRGLSIRHESRAEFAIAMMRYPSPIQRAFRIREDNRVEMFDPAQFEIRSQDLDDAWHDAGQFYWGRADAWLTHKTLFGSDTAPVVLARHLVQDIDTAEDWYRAELMFQAMMRP